jgi:hypothetical protein
MVADSASRSGLGGLLDRLGKPDSRGLTFSDKLFASGSILKGDSGGAASYIQNQRQMADTLSERTRARDIAKRGAAAFKGAMRPDGTVDFQKLIEGYGDDLDPSKAVELATSLAPKSSVMSTANGGLSDVTRPAFGGPATARELIAGTPKEPPKFIPGPNGVPIPNPVYGQYQKMIAAAEREGKPLAPRAPARGRAGPRPKSYDSSEVTY